MTRGNVSSKINKEPPDPDRFFDLKSPEAHDFNILLLCGYYSLESRTTFRNSDGEADFMTMYDRNIMKYLLRDHPEDLEDLERVL